MKQLHFDCFCGASGDMIIGALLDAGGDFDGLVKALKGLAVPGFSLRREKVKKKGIMATQFHVDMDEEEHPPHRHLSHIVAILEKSDLPDAVKAASQETFQRIGEAEARVHGTTIEKIHFHEVGAIDSIVDIVGAHWLLHQLAPTKITASPLHVGSGTVTCAHGVMPVPAPATALLLEGIPSYGGDVEAELVTPTGAALIAQIAQCFGPQPVLTTRASGYGSGTRDLPDRPNVLRVTLGEAREEGEADNAILVVECNVDDMNPEHVPPLIEAVLDSGAKDAFCAPILGKKGRPGLLITVLTAPELENEIVSTLFAHSTTFGLRMRAERRVCLDRDWKTVETPWGPVRVKIGALRGHVQTIAPEFEDCIAAAKAGGVSVEKVYSAARAAVE